VIKNTFHILNDFNATPKENTIPNAGQSTGVMVGDAQAEFPASSYTWQNQAVPQQELTL